MATGSRAKSKFSEEDYQRLLANLARGKAAGEARSETLDGSEEGAPSAQASASASKRKPKAKPAIERALAELAPEPDAPASGALAAALGVPQASIVSDKKKRQGVKETPIMTAVRECSITVEAGPKHIVIVFEGARLFTLNELLAILQYRKYIVFGYKKLWQELVLKALKQMGKDKPHFDGPCNVILFRQGAKMIDRDSFTVMFKYIIDALKDEPRKGVQGIFPDDNPDIVFSDEKRQAIGEPIIALRVELIDPAPQPQTHRAEELFSNPSIWSSRAAKPAAGDNPPQAPARAPKKTKAPAPSEPAPSQGAVSQAPLAAGGPAASKPKRAKASKSSEPAAPAKPKRRSSGAGSEGAGNAV